MYCTKLKMIKFTNVFQCNKLNNEKQALKLQIEEQEKPMNSQKSVVESEVQTQHVFQVSRDIKKKNVQF